MKTFLSLLVTGLFSVLSFSQYCTTAGPTSTADSNVESVQLTGTSGAIAYTGCPGVLGLENLSSSQIVTLTAGQSYNLTVDFGTCGGNYTGVGQAWIDFNLDGLFDVSESLGTWSGIPPAAPQIFTFTVPVNAQSGTTRLRVVQHEGGTLPLDPCAAFTWGSAVDFGVIVTGGIDCSGYPGDVKEDAIPITSIPYTTTGNTSFCYFNQNLVYNSPDIYYRLIPTVQMAQVTVSLCGSLFDTFLSVVDSQGNIIAYNDDGGSCGSSSELTFSAIGIDTAYLIVEGWGSEMGDYTINVNATSVGIEEWNSSPFIVFPNPAKESVTILGAENATIEIHDLTGAIVQQKRAYNGETLNIHPLADGIYLVHIHQNGKTYTSKLTID